MYYTIFFAVWLLSSHAAFAESDGQIELKKHWQEYVAGCNKQFVPPIPPTEQAAISKECIAIFSHVIFGTPLTAVPIPVGN